MTENTNYNLRYKHFLKYHTLQKKDYVCTCEKGSPKPGWVSVTPRDHQRTCEIRKRIARMTFEEGDLLNG